MNKLALTKQHCKQLLNKVLAFGFLCVMTLSDGIAQEQAIQNEKTETPVTEQPEKNNEANAQVKTTTTPEQATKNKQPIQIQDEFIPSEEISKDLSVSFPADI